MSRLETPPRPTLPSASNADIGQSNLFKKAKCQTMGVRLAAVARRTRRDEGLEVAEPGSACPRD